MNNAMRSVLERESRGQPEVPSALQQDLLLARLIVLDRCYVLDYMYESCRHVRPEAFPDEVGFECFVNHVHIDDYVQERQIQTARAVAEIVNGKFDEAHIVGLTVRHIIARNDTSCTYRFHVVRPGQSWVSQDLEAYASEAVLVLDYELPGTHH